MTEAAASPVLARGETVPTELPSDRRLPLVIGVTGHRDLQESDLPALRARLREVFEELARRHPHTPLWLLSPLAEGADCLAAEVALECGMEFIAPLPMPRAAYEQDFTTPEALAKFRELLRQARATFELPPPPDAPLFDEREQASRDRQYCAAAAFVVRHCQLLIALWDGVPAKPDGCGTAQAVQFMRHGVPAEYRPRAGAVPAYETGLVYHIAVRRRGQPWSGEPAALAILPPPDQPLARGVEERVWHAVDGLNRDVLAYSASSAAGNGVTWSRLLGGTVEGQLAPRLRAIDERFAVVDALAARCQRATRRVLILLLVLSFAAAMALQLHLARGAATGSFVLIYAGALAAALVLYVWAKRARFEARHRDYRALAEGLRVQFFWWLAGLEESVADHYLRRQQGVLQWVRNALRTWTMPGEFDPPWPPLSKGGNVEGRILTSIGEKWLEGQAEWFGRMSRRQRTAGRWLRRVAGAMLLASTLLALVKGAIGENEPLTAALAILPIAAAVLLVYSRTRAFAEHANQYERMRRLFESAAQEFHDPLARNSAGVEALLLEVGREALAENADWLILHQERPLETPGLG